MAAPTLRRPIAARLPVAYRAVLLAAGLLAAGLLFQQLVTLLLLVLATIILAIPLAAGATWLERLRIPRWIGALLCLLAAVLFVGGIVALVVPTFVRQAQTLIDGLPAFVEDIGRQFNAATGTKPSETGAEIQRYLQGFVDKPERIVAPATSIGLGIAGAIGGLVFVVATAYYVAVQPGPLVNGLVRLFPPDRREWARDVLAKLRTAWIGWLYGVVADMLVTGILLYIGLTIIGLDFAIVFAVLSALLVVIPYFGSIAGGIPPVLFALTESPTMALLTLGVYILVQILEGNVIIPLVMAKTVKLHPAVIAIGVLIVGQLFGIAGLFVAVPILSAVVILVEQLWVRPVENAHAEPPPNVALHVPAGTSLGRDPSG
jgi:predicted PurR-regulated permease PerM